MGRKGSPLQENHEESHIIIIEKNNRKSPFGHQHISSSCKNHQWMVNLVGGHFREHSILRATQSTSPENA